MYSYIRLIFFTIRNCRCGYIQLFERFVCFSTSNNSFCHPCDNSEFLWHACPSGDAKGVTVHNSTLQPVAKQSFLPAPTTWRSHTAGCRSIWLGAYKRLLPFLSLQFFHSYLLTLCKYMNIYSYVFYV